MTDITYSEPAGGSRRAAFTRLRAAWRLPAFRAWLAVAIACCAAIVGAGFLLDHRTARFAHALANSHPALVLAVRRLVHIPEVAVAATFAVIVVLGFWRAFVGALHSRVLRLMLLAALSVCVAFTLTSVLKVWFGRIPPGIWYYQQWRIFHAWMSGSFPSGHMTVMGAILPFLLAIWRPLAWPWAVAAAATGLGLIAVQGHFVSDLVGGLAVGFTVGHAMRAAARA